MSVAHLPPLDALERTFVLITSGLDPLALDGREVEGLPARLIPLDELRSMLLHPSTSHPTRNAAMRLLVARAQAGLAQWRIGLAGVLLPGLRTMAGRVARNYPGDSADVDAEVLTGLLEALDGFDAGRDQIAARLLWAAYRRADRLRSAELAESARRAVAPRSGPPFRPWGHPDLVLARAVAAGVISAEEAELISATRIGDACLPELADELGVTVQALRKRRRRAELRLAGWLTRPDAQLACPVRDRLGGFVSARSSGSRGARPAVIGYALDQQTRGGDDAPGRSPRSPRPAPVTEIRKELCP